MCSLEDSKLMLLLIILNSFLMKHVSVSIRVSNQRYVKGRHIIYLRSNISLQLHVEQINQP